MYEMWNEKIITDDNNDNDSDENSDKIIFDENF